MLWHLREQHDHQGRVDEVLGDEPDGIHTAARERDQEARKLGGRGEDADKHKLAGLPVSFVGGCRHGCGWLGSPSRPCSGKAERRYRVPGSPG